MKIAALIIAVLSACYVVLAVGTHHTPIIPSGKEIVVGILYYPLTLLAAWAAIYSIFHLLWGQRGSLQIATLILCVPMLGYFSYHPGIVYEKRMFSSERAWSRWSDLGYHLSPMLIEYYRLHPDRFQYIGSDDEVRIDGFVEYAKAHSSVPGYPGSIFDCLNIKIKDDTIYDPWGEPVRFVKDRDGDAEISANGFVYPVLFGGGEGQHFKNPNGLGIVKNSKKDMDGYGSKNPVIVLMDYRLKKEKS